MLGIAQVAVVGRTAFAEFRIDAAGGIVIEPLDGVFENRRLEADPASQLTERSATNADNRCADEERVGWETALRTRVRSGAARDDRKEARRTPSVRISARPRQHRLADLMVGVGFVDEPAPARATAITPGLYRSIR